jgi:tetratricopeptide (TPR) repeat protein
MKSIAFSARSSTGRVLVSVTCALALLIVAARPVLADEAPSDPAGRAAAVAKLSDDGFALYKTRDYRHAVEKFLQAYALDQDPNLLFNIARCYEAMGDPDSAIEKYEIFLAKPDADAQGKRRANEAIRALRQSKSAAAEVPAGGGRATRSASEPVLDRPTPSGSGARAPDAKGSVLSAPVVALVAGVLVAAIGGVSYAMGASDHNKVTGSANYGKAGQVDPLTQAEAQKLVDSGNTKKLIGGIAFGIGGALLATSAALFAFGRHDTEAKARGPVAFGIAPLGGGGGGEVLMQGRF